jgi:non-canonical purine NTP pyrophosphatase (RdgB/HAM1 family)
MDTIYYVTSNNGKFAEIKECLASSKTNIRVEQAAIDIPEIQSLDQKKVSLDKAQKAYELIQKPLLLDDGGIFLEGYNQFPGTLSKFVFQGIGFEGMFKLAENNARASFILQLVYTDGVETHLFEGRCDGKIVQPNDFSAHPQLPFTAIFKPDGSDKTLAELRDTPEFAQYSFRQQALRKFLAWYHESKK